MSSQSKNRILWLDQLRAVAMWIVILGHSELTDEINKFIYSFHMPLFFIISGITFNPRKYENFAAGTWDKFKKLLLPHFGMNLMMLPLWIYTFKILSQAKPNLEILIRGIFYINSGKYQSPSNATWFLAALFLTEVLFYLIWKWVKGEQRQLVIMVILMGLIGFIESKNKTNYEGPWHVEAVFTAIVFFMMGYLLRQNLGFVTEFIQSKKNYLILIMVLLVTGIWCSLENGRVSMNGNSYDSILYFYTAATALSGVIILVIMKLPVSRLLCYVGQNTITYVGIHIPLIRLAQKTCPVFVENPWYALLLAVIVFFVMIPVSWAVTNLFPFVLGRGWPQKTKSARIAVYLIAIAGVVLWAASLFYLIPYVI